MEYEYNEELDKDNYVTYPTLFNLYTEKICRHIKMKGVIGGGRHYNNLR